MKKYLKEFIQKYHVYTLTLVPLVIFIVLLITGKLSEGETLIKSTNSKCEIKTSATITINEIKKDYIYCDLALSCPKGIFDSLTISTDILTGVKVHTKKTLVSVDTTEIEGVIEFLKTEIFKLDDTYLRNKTNDKEFYNISNLKLLVPIEAYKSPFSSINANLRINLNFIYKNSSFLVQELVFRNLDKNQRISILDSVAYVENAKNEPLYKIFAEQNFNNSYHIELSPNNEFIAIFSILLVFILSLLMYLHIYLIKHENVDNGFIGLVFSFTIGIVSIIAFFHNKIADTKSIAELIVYAIYFWICYIIAHSVYLLFKQNKGKE